jgi:hypothetical protein
MGHHHHAAQERSCNIWRGITLLLCFWTTCAETVHSQRVHPFGACRTLANEDVQQSSFVSWLGADDPLEYIVRLYQASGSQEDVGSWLLETAR